MKSILQKDRERCFLCGRYGGYDPLDEHHVLYGPYRKASEKYGLKVYLHHDSCHIFGKNAVHKNAEIDRKLKAYAQKKAMEKHGWTVDDFRAIFGKNYISDGKG